MYISISLTKIMAANQGTQMTAYSCIEPTRKQMFVVQKDVFLLKVLACVELSKSMTKSDDCVGRRDLRHFFMVVINN